MQAPSPVTTRIARFVSGLRWEDIPPEVQDRARDRFLDAVSTGIAGRDIDVSRVAIEAVSGGPGGACSSFVDGKARPAGDAALVNGTSLHSILYEDIIPATAAHPGPVVVPSALAVAEEMAAAGQAATLGDVLAGIVVGYEVECALGRVMASAVVGRGMRTTSVFGTVAAAAAAAKVLGLDEPRISGAINMGANFAFGILQGIVLTGPEMYLQAGVAGLNGILAARLGQAGVDSAALTFEGPTGYFNAFGKPDAAADFRIGDEWRCLKIWCKPYPLSAGKLRGVDAAIAAWQAGIRAKDIRHVTVRMPPSSKNYPGADWRGPFDRFTQAQNSTQFVVSAGLLGRDMTALDTFTKGFADPEVGALMQKVDLVAEPERAATGAERLDIELNDGRTSSFEVEWADGRTPTVAKMGSKLKQLSRGFWPADTADRLVAAVTGLADRPIGEVSAILRQRLR